MINAFHVQVLVICQDEEDVGAVGQANLPK